MNSRERIVSILTRQTPDRMAVYPILSGVTRNLIQANYREWATNAEICAEALIKAQEMFGLDCFCTLTDLSVEASDFGQEIIYPENEAAHPNFDNHYLQSLEDYDKIQEFDPTTSPRMSEHIKLCKILVEKKGKEVPVVAFIFGPLGILSMLRGQEGLYMDMYDDPDKVHEALTKINNVLIKYTDALINTGIDAVMIDTLFASGTIMSKEMWDEFEGVHVEKWAQFVHSKNSITMIHNCGENVYFDVQIKRIKPALISFLHVPDDCKDFADCKEKYGDQTVLMGRIPPTWLPLAKPEEVLNQCHFEAKTFGGDGIYILSTGCEYPANLSFDHAKTICDFAHNYKFKK